MSGGPFDFGHGNAPAGRPGGVVPPPGPSAPGAFPGAPPPGATGAPPPVGAATAPEVGRCPVWILLVVIGLGVVAAVVAILAGTAVVPAMAAWFVAGPLAFSALALYVSRDTRERARGTYTAPGWAPTGYWVAVVTALVAVVLTAFRIAQWAGRL